MKWISFCQERLCSRRFEMLACLTACLWEELCVTTQTILGFHMTSQKFKLRFYFVWYYPGRGGGVLDISLGGEVWPGPSYPDPV